MILKPFIFCTFNDFNQTACSAELQSAASDFDENQPDLLSMQQLVRPTRAHAN